MSDLYMDTQTNIVNKASSARECVLCHGTAKPTNAVWMEKAGVVICQSCAHDLAESLTPKPQTIAVHQPSKPSTVIRKSTMPIDQDRMAADIKAEVYVRLLELGLSQRR